MITTAVHVDTGCPSGQREKFATPVPSLRSLVYTWRMDENKKRASEKERKSLRQEVHRQSMSYMLAAFGFVAGLAWNEAIKALIEDLFPTRTNTLVAKFSYALLVTVLLAVATTYLMWLGGLRKEAKK